ncbi:MAG: bifunctional 2-polyprenyl-6-hydroxyphenol methylase/3-demethylubiquinol 3-O-methyltransferase UbiG, partial [Hydrogenophaga sp.]|nr:bifunctional 2-polyprenyl-6-hydroxyphenol methylase/3-demethylubiquinol 3-O-methyltransferase UbiG [Hydrogenophaga sp.]
PARPGGSPPSRPAPGRAGALRPHCRVLAPDELFDVVLALEVVEHVDDVAGFVDTVARRVAPGGLLIASTIDRTWKSFAFAIVGAEYVLRVLPRGTHQWKRFVRPTELAAAVSNSGLQQRDLRGMQYSPLLHRASWCRDTRVNYIATYTHALAARGKAETVP